MGKRSLNPAAGVLIRQWRDDAELSQAELGVIADVQQSSICDLELGRAGLGLESLESLATTLSLSREQRVHLIEKAGFRINV